MNLLGHILIFLHNVTLYDIIDLSVVSYIIYQCLLIIRGTRAVQMIVGVGTLLICYYASLSFKLYSLNWILANFFDNLFIILVIIFQDNIRNALVTVGGLKLFGREAPLQTDSVVEEVVAACGALSREKTGAIIVFERRNGLLNYRASGTLLDCRIHSDIIYSMFQKNSPLHDGAMIVHSDRIGAAGCFLPLSQNVEIDRHYGTRHRAALGISEISDAIVITVSEETGEIRLCVKGVFYPAKGEEELRQKLKTLLVHENIDLGTKKEVQT